MRRLATSPLAAAPLVVMTWAAFFVAGAQAQMRSHGERPVVRGLAANGAMFEVLASATGSWTAIVTPPQGRSCVVATGEAWEAVAPPVVPEDTT